MPLPAVPMPTVCRTTLLGLLLCLLGAPAWAQAPRVTVVTPAPETVGVPRGGDLVVQFDAPLDLATVTDASFRVLGRWTGPIAGTLALEDGDRRVRFTPAAPLFVGDLVLVQLARTITSADGTPMDHGFAWLFWAEAGPSTLDFAEDNRLSLRQSDEGNIIVYGAHGGDLDGDGDSDLITSQEATDDARVLLNGGAGTYADFAVHPIPGASVPSPLEGADLDHDGDLDVVIGSIANGTVSVLLGDGEGGFESITSYPTAGANGRSVAVGDFDGDGHDDIVAASRIDGVLSFLRGHGDGTFEAAVAFPGTGTNETALAITDANGDGLLDLFVGDHAGGIGVCLGDGDGGFACGPEAGLPNGRPWMIAAGDIDGDGHADVAVASSFANGIEVLYGDGEGGFAGSTFLPNGSFAIAIDLGDLDGDGDLDVVSSNYGSADFSIFENVEGAPTFAFALAAELAGSCMTLHDRDGDGRLDMTGIDERADLALFFSSAPPVTAEPEVVPAALGLAPVENPFRGTARLRLHVPAAAEARLRVFDALGREVAALLDGAVPAGVQTATWDARGLPSGYYFARLEAGGAAVTVPLVLVR